MVQIQMLVDLPLRGLYLKMKGRYNIQAYIYLERCYGSNFIYDSDSKKAHSVKSISGANPTDYELSIFGAIKLS